MKNELLGKNEEIEIVHLATGVQGLHVSCEQGKQAVPYVRKSELDRVKRLADELDAYTVHTTRCRYVMSRFFVNRTFDADI